MGVSATHPDVMRIVAVFSRHDEAFEWTERALQQEWGAISLSSERFEFQETSYYSTEMGSELKKQLFGFDRLMPPDSLASAKLLSNRWEQDYKLTSDFAESRPLNIDPGYLTEAKLVLATTKDRDHRIYLRDGIFAEVTVHYFQRQWTARPWTYPDYMRPEVHDFLDRCRNDLRFRYNRVTS